MIDYQNEIEAQTTYLEGAVEMQKMLNNFTNNQGLDSQLNQKFFEDDNDNQNNNNKTIRKKSITQKKKKRKLYSNTKVKARNLLTNILYRRYKDRDFKK